MPQSTKFFSTRFSVCYGTLVFQSCMHIIKQFRVPRNNTRKNILINRDKSSRNYSYHPVYGSSMEILQFPECLPFLQHSGICHAAVIPGSPDIGSRGIALDFNIHFFPIHINCMHIQGDIAPSNLVIFQFIIKLSFL